MNIVFCNEGRFSSGFAEYAQASGVELKVLYVGGLLNGVSTIHDLLADHAGLKLIYYISGETSVQQRMYLMNYHLPRIIFEYCVKHDIRFVYLSSLAVFVGNYDGFINRNSNFKAIDSYGRSKIKFDEYVITSGYKNYCAIHPASFYSNNGRSSYERLTEIISSIPVLFRAIKFPGRISYVDVKRVYEELISVGVYSPHNRLILACNIPIDDVVSSSYKVFNTRIFVPSLPSWFFKCCSLFFTSRFIYKIRLFLQDIIYE